MRKRYIFKIFFISLLLLLILTITRAADLYCYINQTCTSSTALLRFENDSTGINNSHAQFYNYSQDVYNYTLCCNSTIYTLQNYCVGGTVILRLENLTNSHVQDSSYSSYTYPVCVNTTTSMNCTSQNSVCSAGRTCLLSISNATGNKTNAHVAACKYYATNVCCGNPNTPSSIPILLAPLNDIHTIDTTPTLYWQNSTDIDGDTRTYHIQVDDNSDFTSPTVNVSGIVEGVYNTTYTIVSEQSIGIYFWRVRAYDTIDYSNWSSTGNYTLDSINILVINKTVNFNTLTIGTSNDTTTNNPAPFVIQNDGNVNVNVSIYALDALWSNAALNTEYFQFKIDNFTEENNSFRWGLLSWTNISSSPILAIGNLSYSDTNDSAEVDIKIIAPSGEIAGDKSSTITFESSYSDPP
jgi:hypothetical protein